MPEKALLATRLTDIEYSFPASTLSQICRSLKNINKSLGRMPQNWPEPQLRGDRFAKCDKSNAVLETLLSLWAIQPMKKV